MKKAEELDVDSIIAKGRIELKLRIPWSQGADLTWLYEHGKVLERKDCKESVEVTVRLSEKDSRRVRHMQVET